MSLSDTQDCVFSQLSGMCSLFSLSLNECLFECVTSCLPAEHVLGEATEAPALECCACGTAKYRLTFFGNWSEKVHPKDYPSEFK